MDHRRRRRGIMMWFYSGPARQVAGGNPVPNRFCCRQAGFTLLEVLIALSILAILMTGLIKIAANNTRNLWFLENTTIAEQVAQNRLLQLRLAEDKPEAGDGWEEMAGRRWYWQVSRAVAHSLGDGVWRYRVQVFLEGEKTAYVDLVGYVTSES